MTGQPLRLDLAIRTSKRKKEARSPEQQHDMAFACARVHGYDIVKVHDSGRDESGGTMDRATLNAVMERVQAGQTDGLIVALTDRLSRAPIEEAMAFIRRLVEDHHGVLVLADGAGTPIDLDDEQAESNLVMQLQWARQYRQGTAKRAMRTKRGAIKAGKYVGPAPLGYDRESGRLVPDEHTGPVMSRAYELAARNGPHAALEYLRVEVPGRKWDLTYVRRLLASRAYLGESRSGDLVNEEAHPPLTTLATWTAAQSDPRQRRASGDYPLSHMVVCGRCGSGLVGQLQTAHHGRTYRRMRCAASACRGGTSINADKLEVHILDVLTVALDDHSENGFRSQFAPAGLEDARRALAAAQDAVATWSAMPAARRARLGADYDTGLDVRLDEREHARTTVTTIERQASDYEDLPLSSELGDPVQFAKGLRALTSLDRLVVAPGRGKVGDRVTLDPHRRDDAVRMLAA